MEFTGERVIPHDPELHDLYVEHLARYVFAEQWAEDARVLDVGCGCGYGTYHLAKRAAWAVGVDLSYETVAYSAEHYRRSNLTYAVMDARRLVFPPQSFDLVVSFEFIEHIREQESVLAGTAHILGDDGMLVISTPNADTYKNTDHPDSGNPYHLRELRRDEFCALLASYFEEITLFGQRRAPEYLSHSEAHELMRVWLSHLNDRVTLLERKQNRVFWLMLRALVPRRLRRRLSVSLKQRLWGMSRDAEEVTPAQQAAGEPECLPLVPPPRIMTLRDSEIGLDFVDVGLFFIAVCRRPRRTAG